MSRRPSTKALKALESFLSTGEKTRTEINELEHYREDAAEEMFRRYGYICSPEAIDRYIQAHADLFAGLDLEWLEQYGYVVAINPGMHPTVQRWRWLGHKVRSKSPHYAAPWSEWDPEWKKARDDFRAVCKAIEAVSDQRHVERYEAMQDPDDVGVIELTVQVRYRITRGELANHAPEELAAEVLEQAGDTVLIARGAKLQESARLIRDSVYDDDQVIAVDFTRGKRE